MTLIKIDLTFDKKRNFILYSSASFDRSFQKTSISAFQFIVFSWKLLGFVLLTHCRETDNIIVAKIKLGNQFETRF